MPEIPRHIPEAENPAETAIRRYVTEHLHEPEFADAAAALHWGLAEVLPHFEVYCNRLREQDSPELYRARELTYFLDRQVHSGGHAKMSDPHEITLLLAPDIGDRLSKVSHHDSLERLEAQAEHDRDLGALREYERSGTVEPVLAIVENRVAWLDHLIDIEARQPNKNAADERRHRDKIKELDETRKRWRRARIFLLKSYFPA